MQIQESYGPDSAVYTRYLPDDGKYLVEWYEMDCGERRFEGTWAQVQDFFCYTQQSYWWSCGPVVLVNSRGEVMHMDVDGHATQC